jgi:hypothetical protein
MEPEVSLPCSQETAFFLYPEPDESSPHPQNIFLQGPFYYYPNIYFSKAVLSIQVFWPKLCMHFSTPICATCPLTLTYLTGHSK